MTSIEWCVVLNDSLLEIRFSSSLDTIVHRILSTKYSARRICGTEPCNADQNDEVTKDSANAHITFVVF